MSRLGALIRELRRLKRAAERVELAHIGLIHAGSNVSVGEGSELSPSENIFVGHDVFIGRDCWFSTPNARITIGSKVMFAPQCAIITGDHDFSRVGVAMFDVHEKRPEDDVDVTVEDDVWVGFRACILKGVTLGRGCVVGAGSVVTRDVLPYSIVAGSPAKLIGMRFNAEQVRHHERILGIDSGTESETQ